MRHDKRVLNQFYSHAEAMYESLKKSEDNEVIFHFVGDLNQEYANAISSKLESIVEVRIPDNLAQKRFYTAYIEAIQNIRLHGISDSTAGIVGGVTVSINGNKICSRFLNIIPVEKGTHLKEKYEEINALQRDALKKRYLDQMMHGDISVKGGAGMGIITIVLRSQNPSKVRITPLNDQYAIFESEVCVDYQSVKK